MPESINIGDGLKIYRMNLREARQFSPVKEKRFVEKKSLKNLIYHIFGTHTEINHNQYGKPLLVGHSGNISVSHNTQWLVVLYSENHAVGVDIEEVQDRILRLQGKFLSENEMPDYRSDKLALTVAWCAKESVLKCIGFRSISFQKHLHIKNFDFVKKELLVQSTWSECKGMFDVRWIEEGNHIIAYAIQQQD
ncbi:MAG: 4'-phosphopantetheinyl transferase superfamily protein [Bacteroidia bacterium]|nr:4'-phosphopantetheinyl transferase superfamily protein [Bacteroidia bacterium]